MRFESRNNTHMTTSIHSSEEKWGEQRNCFQLGNGLEQRGGLREGGVTSRVWVVSPSYP